MYQPRFAIFFSFVTVCSLFFHSQIGLPIDADATDAMQSDRTNATQLSSVALDVGVTRVTTATPTPAPSFSTGSVLLILLFINLFCSFVCVFIYLTYKIMFLCFFRKQS
jgi:hypothetical protein